MLGLLCVMTIIVLYLQTVYANWSSSTPHTSSVHKDAAAAASAASAPIATEASAIVATHTTTGKVNSTTSTVLFPAGTIILGQEISGSSITSNEGSSSSSSSERPDSRLQRALTRVFGIYLCIWFLLILSGCTGFICPSGVPEGGICSWFLPLGGFMNVPYCYLGLVDSIMLGGLCRPRPPEKRVQIDSKPVRVRPPRSPTGEKVERSVSVSVNRSSQESTGSGGRMADVSIRDFPYETSLNFVAETTTTKQQQQQQQQQMERAI